MRIRIESPTRPALLAVGVLLALSSAARAQNRVQRMTLEPGWNSVWLEIDPSRPECESIVARSGGRIEAIWSYDNRNDGELVFEPVEFDPDIEVPPVRVANRWHLHHVDHGHVSNLSRLRGGHAYLVRVRDGSEPFDLVLSGRPVPNSGFWVPHDFSLRGFAIDPLLPETSRPTFAEYFVGSPAHLDKESKVYAVKRDGSMGGPLDKKTTRIDPGRAYWVYTNGVSRYRGPVEIADLGADGLDFGRIIVETTLRVRNNAPLEQELVLRLRSESGKPRLRVFDPARELWVDVGETGTPVRLGANESRSIRIHAVRKGLPTDTTFDGELVLSNDNGFEDVVVAHMERTDFAGLWVGEARLRYVRLLDRSPPEGDQPGSVVTGLTGFPEAERDGAPELSFPLILHVGTPDRAGAPSTKRLTLLRQAALMWRTSRQVDTVTVPGRYALVTRRGLEAGLLTQTNGDGTPAFVGGSLRDGRRFSHLKTASTFHDDFTLVAPGGTEANPEGAFLGDGEWKVDVNIPRLHPLNPFLHRYHPDHGHPFVMSQRGNPARGGLEVDRALTLTFSHDDPFPLRSIDPDTGEATTQDRPGYGDTIIGGAYREVISTLTYDPVVVEGNFELRISAAGIDELDDGLLGS